MFPIPLYFFLAVYLLFTIGTFVYFIFNIYHIFAADELALISLFVTVFIGSAMILVLIVTWSLLSSVDWSQSFSVFDNSWISAPDSFQ